MQVPLQITLRDIEHSDAVEKLIRQKVKKLNRFCDQIISCQVVIEYTQRHQHSGKLYNVRINLTVPKKELIANHNNEEDLYVGIHEAFDDMMRQLEEVKQIRSGDVKSHPELLHGEVARIFKEDDFGFIVTPDGDEFYFNANNVIHPSFERLEVGTPVRFIEAMGDEGPQAHRVSAKEKE